LSLTNKLTIKWVSTKFEIIDVCYQSGMKIYKTLLFIILIFIFVLSLTQPTLSGENKKIYFEFFYSSTCGKCKEFYDEVQAIENNESYNDTIIVQWKDIATNPEYKDEYKDYNKKYGVWYPFFVVKNNTNETIIIHSDATLNYLEKVINDYIRGRYAESQVNKSIIEVDFLFWNIKLNVSSFSLPVLVIILGGVDSFNPCAFFILIFLLNLLIYAKTRRRMLLIGGVFIFFSGFLYLIFMFILTTTLSTIHTSILSILIGLITLVLGVLNIKDFFYFKKGVTLSIPEEKKPKLFKQMRKLVKTPQVLTAIIGTITLAATVNFYELLCSLGLPLVFINRLTSYNLSMTEYSLYILFYNIIYVIPLIIILLIFVITLGHRKLSEWHGRVLKFFSGVMLASFGVLFLFNYTILENVFTPIALLLFSLTVTGVISQIWKKYNTTDE